MKNYSQSPFKLNLPSLVKGGSTLEVCSKMIFQNKGESPVLLFKAVFIDRLNNKLPSNTKMTFESSVNFKVLFENNTKKIFTTDSRIILEFITAGGQHIAVCFACAKSDIITLNDVSVRNANDEEKSIYSDELEQMKVRKAEEIDGGHAQTSDKWIVSNAQDLKNDSITNVDFGGLEKYKKALSQEKFYLKNLGGKKHKVTEGKLISHSNGEYNYLFELESELFLSDDAPITLFIGPNNYSGTVLMCEDFQIMLTMKQELGNRIPTAFVHVEPWRLLEALEERITHGIHINGGIAKNLLKDGPNKATKMSIDKIEKGHDAVIKHAMSEPVTVVWGPPGTGKTHTMSELAIKFIEAGKSVLIVSHSNVSVDGVAKKIKELLDKSGRSQVYKGGNILRYGYVRDEELGVDPYISSFKFALNKFPDRAKKLNELQKEYYELKKRSGWNSPMVAEIHKKIGEIHKSIREEEKLVVSKAKVVATTISKVTIDKLFENKTYDVVMFDEVSMAYVLQVVCAATFAKKHLICVGDFMQLAPIAVSEAKKILCEDIFTYLKINVNGTPYYHPWLVMLHEQRRMHPMISGFVNKYVYGQQLKNHESVFTNRKEIVEAVPFRGNAINYIDLIGSYCAATKTADNSRYNILSAVISFATAVNAEENVDSISVIAPYAAQTRLIRALIRDYRENNGNTSMRCATVHQFQGSESDVIVFDAVESYPGQNVGFLMGKEKDSIKRLINVAVTRARGKLLVVGNSHFWENAFANTSHTLYCLQKYIFENGRRIKHVDNSLEDHISKISVPKTVDFYMNATDSMNNLIADIQKAKNKIVISLPSGHLDSKYQGKVLELLLALKQNGIKVLVKSNGYDDLPSKWKQISKKTENAIFPLVVIDDKITWYGLPYADWEMKVKKDKVFKTVCQIPFRIKGTYTVELIKSFTDLEMVQNDNFKDPLFEGGGGVQKQGGLAEWIQERRMCECCKKPLKLTVGKSGKTILWCKNCKKVEWLTTEEVDQYIWMNDITCPNDGGELKAKLKNGLYIWCNHGHSLKPLDI